MPMFGCRLLLVLALSASIAVAADPFTEGISAYNAKAYAKAYALWKPLALSGEVNAQHNIAYMLEHGQGVQQNAQEAREWYAKAAQQGHAGAQINLGSLYYRGVGGPSDDAQAFYWYKQAADQGNPQAQSAIGDFYLHGIGVPQDEAAAITWYEKAAHLQDNVKLALFIGQYYIRKAQLPKALAWFQQAAAHGNAEAQTIRNTLYTRLFPAPLAGWSATKITVKRKALDSEPSDLVGTTSFVGLYRRYYTTKQVEQALDMAITINNLPTLSMLDVMHRDPTSMDDTKRALLTQLQQAGFRPYTFESYQGVAGYDAKQHLSVLGVRLNDDIAVEFSANPEGKPIPEQIFTEYLKATDWQRLVTVLEGHGKLGDHEVNQHNAQ